MFFFLYKLNMKYLEGVVKTTGIFACVNSINSVEVLCIFQYEKFNNDVQNKYKDFFSKYDAKIKDVVDAYKKHESTYFDYKNAFKFFDDFRKSLENHIEDSYGDTYRVLDGIRKHIRKIQDFRYAIISVYDKFKREDVHPKEEEIKKLFEKIEDDDLYDRGEFKNFKKSIEEYKVKFIEAINKLSTLKTSINRDYFDKERALNDEISSAMPDNLKKHIKYFEITNKVFIWFQPCFSSDRNQIEGAKTLDVEVVVNYKDKSYYDSNNLLKTASNKYFKLKDTIYKKIEDVKKIIKAQNLGSLNQEFPNPIKTSKEKSITLKKYLKNTFGLKTEEEVSKVDYDKRPNYYEVIDLEGKLEIYVYFNKYDLDYLDCGNINITMNDVSSKETFVPLKIDSYGLEDGVLYENEEELKYAIAKKCIDKLKEGIKTYKDNDNIYDFDKVFNEKTYKTIVKDIKVTSKDDVEINGKKFIMNANAQIDYDDNIYVTSGSKGAFDEYFVKVEDSKYDTMGSNITYCNIRYEDHEIKQLTDKIEKLNKLKDNLKDGFYLNNLGLTTFIENKMAELNLELDKRNNKVKIYEFLADKKDSDYNYVSSPEFKTINNFLNGKGGVTKDDAIVNIKKVDPNITSINDNLEFKFDAKTEPKEIKYKPFNNNCIDNIEKALGKIKEDEEKKKEAEKKKDVKINVGKNSDDIRILNELNKLLSSIKEEDTSNDLRSKLNDIVGEYELTGELKDVRNKINAKIEDKITKELASKSEAEKHQFIGDSLKQLLNGCDKISSSQIQNQLDSIIKQYSNPNEENATIIQQIKDKIEAKKKEEQIKAQQINDNETGGNTETKTPNKEKEEEDSKGCKCGSKGKKGGKGCSRKDQE